MTTKLHDFLRFRGVFCKVKGEPLHPECFKCSTCSASLKNVGYFNVNNKLYCETHARAAKASQNIGQQFPQMAPQQQQLPSQTGNTASQWKQVLDGDQAGAATNAEDFTKQFMSQMYGGGGGQQPQQATQGKNTKNHVV